MNLTTQWMQSEWIRALGWTFVHSLWQIALIGFLLFIVLRLIPGRSAHMRYTISTLALWSIVIMSLCTFIIMLPDTRQVTEITGNIILVKSKSTITLTERISSWLEARIPMMLMIWLGGVTILMIRLAVSLGWVRYTRKTSIPEEEIQTALNEILLRLRLKINPTAAGSGLVSSPVTIGHLKPLILFPIGIINQLNPKEVEAILAHELAHIVRRDYLSNLVQSFIETLFYYHPIIWWISGMVRAERENRADDLAVSWCGDHLGYAKALMTVQEMQVQQSPSLAIGFASRKNAMLSRIQRILNIPYKNHNQMEKTVLLSLCSLCLLAFTLTGHTYPENKAEKSTTIPQLFLRQEIKTDSIPTEGTYRIHKKTDDQDISIEVENGDIKELKIDGKKIEPSEFDSYDQVIDDLFGSMDSPPSMEGFEFQMPEIPEIPEIPELPEMSMMQGFHFEMPPIPEIPEMPEINFNSLLDGQNLRWLGDGASMELLNGEGLNGLHILCDSTPDGMTKIIIINGGDSSVICTPHLGMGYQDLPPGFDVHAYALDEEAMKKYEDEWREQWKQQEEQWKEQEKQWKNQYKGQGDQWRLNEEQMREMEQNHMRMNEDQQRQMEKEYRMMDPEPLSHMRTPRLSLSDEMVRDGLIQPGEEVEVQLTPDKLKINGQKMPEGVHQKYLEMYEQQQGLELSGNSRVEFTTKSKQRM